MSFARSERHDISQGATFAESNVTGKRQGRKPLILTGYLLPYDMMTFYIEGKSIMCAGVYAGGYVKFTYAYIGLFKTPICHDTNVTPPSRKGGRHGRW